MKKALLKDSIIQIKKTYKRFLSIVVMALLGVGFFAGVRASSPDMEKTLDNYFDKQEAYDIQILSTLGLTNEDIEVLKKFDGTDKIVGTYSEDVFVDFSDEEVVIKVHSLDELNRVNLIQGEIPKTNNECLIDSLMADMKNVKIGDEIEIKENLEDNEEESFKEKKLKVVGIAKTPLYISYDKGTSSLGSGKVSYFIYVMKDNMKSDIFTEVYISLLGTKDCISTRTEYKDKVKEVKSNIELIKDERQNSRYDSLVSEANEKLNDAQNKLDDEKKNAEEKIADAEKEIQDGKRKIQDAEKKIKDGENEFKENENKANVEFANAEAEISSAETELGINQQKIADAIVVFENSKKEAEDGITHIDNGIKKKKKKIKELENNKNQSHSVLDALSKIDSTISSLNSKVQEYSNMLNNNVGDAIEINSLIIYVQNSILDLEAQKQELLISGITENTIDQINNGISECNNQKMALENQKKEIQDKLTLGEAEIVNGQNKIAEARNQLAVSKSKLVESKNEAYKKIEDGRKELEKSKKDLQRGKKELQDGEKELEEKKQEFNEKILDAEKKLVDAREKVNDIKNAKWYILDRMGNIGYNSYSTDIENIEKLGKVFPVAFFIIATLISLTSMTRMVEEERIQIGTLKALGYTKLNIMSKYIIYSFSASVIGGIIGSIIGLKLIPTIILSMYQMMYNIDDLVIEYNWFYSLIGILIMTICIVGATIYTANKELSSMPAELMRPKAPKTGKRVFLEKIGFIWKRLSFTRKVTVRNMFRYKKRFLMTIFGISGCTALILSGFGLKDSISRIMDYQYIDIYNYDMLIGLKDTLNEEEIISLVQDLESKDEIKKCMPVYMNSEKVKNNELEENAQIVVIEDSDEINNYIRFKDLETGEPLKLENETVIITDKLAQLVNVKKGDTIKLINSDDEEFSVIVGEITEHYISHYIYITKDLYEQVFKEEVNNNVLFAQYEKKLTDLEEDKLAEQILLDSRTSSINKTTKLMKTMDETLSAMNSVVYVLIISAGLLAFVVLYNLSNINISERIRELATIKVLGFYDKEVFDYITREIVLLTIIGIVFGLVLGYILNSFILSTCEIGMLRFKRIILPQSYIISALITIVFTIIVNYVTYFSLKQIDMIEALKSVE